MLMQRKKTRMEEYMERRNKDKRFAAEAQEKKEEKPKVWYIYFLVLIYLINNPWLYV